MDTATLELLQKNLDAVLHPVKHTVSIIPSEKHNIFLLLLFLMTYLHFYNSIKLIDGINVNNNNAIKKNRK